MSCKIPVELQDSYRQSSNYPENIIPSEIYTNRSKLTSYKKRLSGVEYDLCLVDGQDEVEETFDIPVIDIGLANGKRKHAVAILG